jgi:hypothetical protein
VTALAAFRVTGTDDPADQVSVDEWNNLLTAIENGTSLTGLPRNRHRPPRPSKSLYNVSGTPLSQPSSRARA